MISFLDSSRRLLTVLVLGLGVTVAFATATPASAAVADPVRSERRNHYGAIALSVDAAGGIANEKSSKRSATRRAKAVCKRRSNYPGQCEVAVWVRNGCAAVAVKRNANGFVTRYGWAVRAYKGPAIRAAKHKCGSKCKRFAWVCTTRHF